MDRRLYYPRDRAKYIELFKNAGGARRVGESSTNYLMSHRAPDLIHELNPRAHIVAMIRNPVDLIYSFHNQRLSMGAEPYEDFEKVLEVDEDRRSGKLNILGVTGYGLAYRDRARMGEQLQRWLDKFGRDQVHVIVYDDFMRATPGEYAKVLRFLDVDPGFRPEKFEIYNSSHRRRKGPVRMLAINPVTRWLGRTALPRVIGEQRTSAIGRRLNRQRLNRRQHERPPLALETRLRLEDEFAADVRKLGRLIGRDLEAEWFAEREESAKAA
jgi:hypothetical protein